MHHFHVHFVSNKFMNVLDAILDHCGRVLGRGGDDIF